MNCDDECLASCAGLVPVMTLATQTGLSALLADKVHTAAPRIKSRSANLSPKLTTVIAGMCAGADSIDDLDIVRGGVKRIAAMAAEFQALTPELYGSATKRAAVAVHEETLRRQLPVMDHRIVALLAEVPAEELSESSVAAALSTLLRISAAT